MPTVIDALIVTLGLDPSGFTKGQKQATEAMLRTKQEASAAAKELEARGKQGAQFFSQIRNAAICLFAVFTGASALRNFGRDAAASDAAVGRMARTLGIATDRLSAYQGVAERVGASRDSVTSSMQSIQDQVERFKQLGTPLSGIFRSTNVELADQTTGESRAPEAVYRDIIRHLSTLKPGEQSVRAQEFGVGPEAVQFARLPEAELNRLFEDQRRLGTVTESQAAAGQRLLKAWLDLSQAFESGWRDLRERLTPAIELLLKSLTDFTLWLSGPDFKPAIDALSNAIKWLADYLGSAQFRSDMEAFGRGLRDMGAALLRTLRYFGLLAPEVAENGATPAGPADGGPGMNRLGNRIEQDRAANRPGWGDLIRQNLPAWMGGYGAGRSPHDVAGAQREAHAFFTANGYTPEQAAGLVANLHHESGLNPQVAAGDGGRSHGIAQWNDSRLQNFRDRNQGRMPEQTTLQEQLEFARWELSEQGPEAAAGRAIRAARTAREAGQLGSRRWLRPGKTEEIKAAEAQARGDTANNFVPALTTPPAGGAVPGPQSYLDPGLLTGSRASMASVSNRSNTSSSEVHIGQVAVHTQATEASGIAQSLGEEIKRFSFVDQASRGMA